MGQSIIGSWTFLDDSPLGVTSGYNGPNHLTNPQLIKDMLGCGMSRIRVNAVCDMMLDGGTAHTATAATLVPFSADPSTWWWVQLDDAVSQANKAGIRVTLIVRGLVANSSWPGWTESGACDAGHTKYATTPAAYAKMAVAMARRYSGDGNPANKIDAATGKRLQVDCIEIGNEENNNEPDLSGNYTGCRDPLRYVQVIRAVCAAMRASVANGGGNWVPRGNFQARVGHTGIVHNQSPEVVNWFTIVCAPPTNATYNASGNHNSIFGFDPSLAVAQCRVLDQLEADFADVESDRVVVVGDDQRHSGDHKSSNSG